MKAEREQERPERSESTSVPGGALALPDLVPGLGEEISEVSESLAKRTEREELAAALVKNPARSAMLTSFGLWMRAIIAFLFAHVLFEKRNLDNLRDMAKRGRMVYVMRSRSLLDYMYFNWALLEHDLPLSMFANDISMMWARGIWRGIAAWFKRPSNAPDEAKFEALLAHDKATFIFLERPRNRPEDNLEYSQKYLFRLVRQQRGALDKPIFVVPMLLLWERRPDPRHVSFLDDIFGTVQTPGFFRKVWGYGQTLWQSFFNLGQPMVQVSTAIDVRELLREYPNAGSADASDILRERLLESLQRERQIILGPQGKTPDEIYREIAARDEIKATIKEISRRDGQDEKKLRARVRDYFDEIAANQSLFIVKVFSLLLSLVWYRIYDGFEVDEEGLERLREVAKTHSLILIPSHKSHIDYLVISYLFYHYGLIPPHIAAGVNLSFFPIGPLFRRSGAFFIRRSFKGEELYPVVFREYVVQLMQQGYPIEFFIEGTRSRTGKLIKPRYGMLDMVLRAFVSGRVENVAVVPISVGYEKIIEASSYKHELEGGEKKKEGLAELLKTPKVLTSRYGRLYVQFAEPIDLGKYLERYDISTIRPDEEKLESLLVRLGHRIIYDINHVTSVTPSALAATVLLGNEDRHMARDRMLREVGFLIRFLLEPERGARLSSALESAVSNRRHPLSDAAADRESELGIAAAPAIDEVLALFSKDGQVRSRQEGDELFYEVGEDARHELSFYRNNIVHLFVPEALLSMALLKFRQQNIPYIDAREETRFLSGLFKYEWIYEERAEFENVFSRTLHYFERTGWLTLKKEGDDLSEFTIELERERPAELMFLRRVILSFLEAYAIMVAHMHAHAQDGPRSREDLIDEVLKQGRADHLRGEVLFMESLSKPTMLNVLRLLEEWGVILKESSGKKETNIRVDDAWIEDGRLERLAHRLEALVYIERSNKTETLRLGS
jgi:glycerol-3-phosphate O-acyltransferase